MISRNVESKLKPKPHKISSDSGKPNGSEKRVPSTPTHNNETVSGVKEKSEELALEVGHGKHLERSHGRSMSPIELRVLCPCLILDDRLSSCRIYT
ncbi:hypothetical protein GWI33_019393 [Rhynchophorus ferrugineus]|uniref:Uncharacterized protein n=1 Tax=Rhynchophorus ferrugineus TaxID=354439 RepID=A0A834M737_RHYFE|nr:hypothetical protein GWI33_019393 [Rhynchophorus ferrugineus]